MNVTKISDEEIEITVKQYDPNTGEEIDSRVDSFLKSTLETNLKSLKEQVKFHEDLLAEF